MNLLSKSTNTLIQGMNLKCGIYTSSYPVCHCNFWLGVRVAFFERKLIDKPYFQSVILSKLCKTMNHKINSKEVKVHILAWLVWISIQSLLFPFKGPSLLLYIVSPVQYFLPLIIVFYVLSLYIMPRFWPANLPGLMISSFALFALFACFAGFRVLMFYQVLPALDSRFTFDLSYPYSSFIRVSFLWFLQHAFFAVAYFGYKYHLQVIQKKAELEKEVVELEYAFLKSQFNPHFLFNTLSYIYSKVLTISEDLADSIIRLAWMMRYSLQEGDSDRKVSLEDELEYVSHLIHLYQLRVEGKSYIDFQKPQEVDNRKVAPLVLASLVENAIKHGKLNDPAHPLKIQIEVNAEQTAILVSNRKAQYSQWPSHGIGSRNLERRLVLVYPQRHHFSIKQDAQNYNCRLILYETDPKLSPHRHAVV